MVKLWAIVWCLVFLIHSVVYVDDTALLLPSATDATTSLKSFSDSASHIGLNFSFPKTKNYTVESVDSFVYLGSLQVIGWSVSPRPNTPYRPRLCSHDVSKTDMERQAPDTRHQAPYIPDTLLSVLLYGVRSRHLDLTIS